MGGYRQAYIYAGIAILFWSTVPTAFKICLGELSILPMLTIASLTSTLVLLIFVIAGNKYQFIWQITRKELLNSAFLGLLNPFIYYQIVLRAYSLLPAQVAQPLNLIWPILIVFLSVPLLRQKISGRSYIALFTSFAGVYIISSQGRLLDPVHSDLNGILLATGSSVFFAFYFIMNVRDKRDESVKLFMNFLFGSIYLTIAMTIKSEWHLISGIKGVASAIYIGLFEMGVSFFLWLKALQLAPSTDKVSTLVYLGPFLSLVFVHFILDEPVYYTTPAGLLLIISGILIQNRKQTPV